ncbi:MAG: hypothetical protein E2O41_08280 [Nitrospina sp.]|nr:MAG: hypothetical protein E2O41_08280 [Nitrospina sp.]
MILRRIADGIRKQDWFVVMVEIMIVVVGIFIGLQVDDWNDARKDRMREALFLERIHDELALDIGEIQDSIGFAIERRAMGQLLLNAVDDPELVRADPTRFIVAVERAGYTLLPTINDHTFEELKSGGDLAIIRDAALRSALIGYYSLIERLDSLDFFREFFQAAYLEQQLGILTPEQHGKLVPLDETAEFTEEEALEALERMRARPGFIEQIPRGTSGQPALGYFRLWQATAQDLRARISAVLGRTAEQ